jgi:hypothetical protein
MKRMTWFLLLAGMVAALGCHWHHHGAHCGPGCDPAGGRGGGLGPGGYAGGPAYNLPPAAMLYGPGPGVDGPGPGVMIPEGLYRQSGPPTQILFVGPEGMVVHWDVSAPRAFDSEPLVCPGSYDFPQAAIYRLRLTNIPGRPGVELYPTLEVGPATPRTEAYLAHNSVPVQFTEEDFAQVLSGNFVTKVIYLPDAEYQQLAIAGVETLVSTRLDPGVDPIVEADRRGSILAIVRMGNKDLQLPGAGGAAAQIMPVAHRQGAPGQPYAETVGVTIQPGYVSGVTIPPYGMPYVGTPIGLPGPPHLPLGHPGNGLRRHTVTNHTKEYIPDYRPQVDIHVKQNPPMSYPPPVTKVRIEETAVPGPGFAPYGAGYDTGYGASGQPYPASQPQPAQQQ